MRNFLYIANKNSNQNTGGFVDGNTNPALNDYEYDANDFRVKKIENLFCEESERSSITSLFRTTADAYNNAIQMDNLTYAYENGNGNSNLLKNGSDAVSTQNTAGFVDGNTSLSLDDYEYDANGNMVKDRNKGIESIAYNHLNLPTKITWSNEKNISYRYTAAGQKLKKTVRDNDSIKIVDYLDGFQYAGNVLQFFPHPEGYVKVTAISAGRGLPTSDFAFNYVFNYTDHLGNVRLSYTKDPQTGTLDILDENHYYPFGLKHGVYSAGNLRDFKTANLGGIDIPVLEQVLKTDYQYKYNGMELQDELGLNMYAMDMRHYDPAIARWVVHDPITHFYQSPYSAFDGNPVFWADPSGASVTTLNGKDAQDFIKRLQQNYKDDEEKEDDDNNNFQYNSNTNSAQNLDNGDPEKNKTKETNDKTGVVAGAYDPMHNHETYKTKGGETKNIYKSNGKPRSQRANRIAKVSKFVKGVPWVTFGVSLGFDAVGVNNYYYNKDEDSFKVHPGKAGLNIFVGGLGFTGFGTPASLTYGFAEAFHPEGAEGALEETLEVQKKYREQNNGAVIKPRL